MMFKDSEETYVVDDLLARSHAIMSRVLTKSQITLLLSSSNLKELHAMLLQTTYGDVLGDVDLSVEPSKGAKKLKESFFHMVINFYSQASESVKIKILLYSQRYHAENLRHILHGKYQQIANEEILNQIITVPKYSYSYYERLLRLPIIEIINQTDIPELKRSLLQAYQEFESTKRFTPIESAIDQHIYKILRELSPYYEKYINLQNILALCRCLDRNIPPFPYILPYRFISKGLKATSVHQVLELYNHGIYGDIFGKYIGEKEIPLHELELDVEKYQLKIWKKVYRSNELSTFDELLAFFELKLAETMDIIRIIVGINAELSTKEIVNNLLFYNVSI
ncbi:MAG: V-type ATPase subunit [Candidatus Heimdallarchaeaceae archaeon]